MRARAPETTVPLRRDDSAGRGHEWWGVAFGLAALAALLASLVVSWFYLRFAGPAWPLEADPPALGLPLVATAIALLAACAAAASGLSAPRERAGMLGAATVGLMVLGIALLALLAVEVAGSDLRATADARASLFYTLNGFVIALGAVGVLLAGGVAIRALRGDFSRERHAAVQILATWWYFTVVAWLAVFATLYLAERVLG